MKHKSDFIRLRVALSNYYKKYNKYPIRESWICPLSDSNYIQGLVPDFIDELPLDPRGTTNCEKNYLYMSDGKNYKFIAHGVVAHDIKSIDEEFLDPTRGAWAYGIWSDGGINY